MKPALITFGRVFFGVLGLGAIITEIIALQHRSIFTPGNFFSYFTVLSNVAAGLWLVAYELLPFRNSERSQGIQLARGAFTLCMLMTGVIFALLLAPIENAVLTAVPWDNIVLHYIMPIAIVADWLLVPGQVSISFKQSLIWLVPPGLYVAYTLVRGQLVGWYPYPFLNIQTHGYPRVLAMVLALLIGVVGACFALSKTPKLLQKDYPG